MSSFKKIKKNSLLISLLILLNACGGGSKYAPNDENTFITSTGENIELGDVNPICQKGTAQQRGQVRNVNTNKGIPDVTVTVEGCSVKTDLNGDYILNNILTKRRTSVTFKKQGYIENSAIISINHNTKNYLEFSLEKSKWSWSYHSKNGTDGGAVNISEDTTYMVDDNNFTGDINAYYSFQNTNNNTEGRDLFPGTFQGIDTNDIIVSFISYAFFNLELKDTQGNNINTSGDIIVKLNNVQNLKDEVIPLWYYNYDKGIWIEKGSAYRDANGDYICEIPHLGTWSLNKTIETEMGLYKARIVDTDDIPITNVRVKAKGKNWVSIDLSTDENGEFEIYVVPNQKFTLEAYDYENKFGAEYPNALSPIAPGDVVEQ